MSHQRFHASIAVTPTSTLTTQLNERGSIDLGITVFERDVYANKKIVEQRTIPLAFDDAEHLAALLRDLALIVRAHAGVGATKVA
jgi:hypothetical protein